MPRDIQLSDLKPFAVLIIPCIILLMIVGQHHGEASARRDPYLESEIRLEKAKLLNAEIESRDGGALSQELAARRADRHRDRIRYLEGR